MADLMVSMALVVAIVFPLAYSFVSERRLARADYQRAVAMEIVDGEMEALVAGEWRSFTPGEHDYPVTAAAATNLLSGRFVLSVQSHKLQLEWRPAGKHQGGRVSREAELP